MSFVRQALTHPRQLWIRRVNFQIHLWAGTVIASYATVIGLTGSILVFGAELSRALQPRSWPQIQSTQPLAALNTIVDGIRLRYPHTHIISLMAPTATDPVFIATLQKRPPLTIGCHPTTGQVLGDAHRTSSGLDWIYDLHENLLARRTGRIVNGLGACAILLLALTGFLNWWPGVRSWSRALTVDFRRKWKRVNFDLHRAAGFWTFFFLVFWAATGIYFVWPDKIATLIARLSPTVNARLPAVTIDDRLEPTKLDFDAMLKTASSLDEGARFEGVIFPSSRRSPFEVLMTRSPAAVRDREDILYFNPYNGRYIRTWRHDANRTLGDWIIWLAVPLHFGTHWGLAVKIVWAAFGLALPLLSITGVLMYWNRVLGKKWPRQRFSLAPTVQKSTDAKATSQEAARKNPSSS